jgi:6-pyruvoyltetrahydropterin/6-carboxytetrahydropterin synthase
MISVIRYHDISCGHRVYGHESKCAHLHGHNYRVYFECAGERDNLGRVIDFGVMKEKLCMWLEDNWDHKFLVWSGDPYALPLGNLDPHGVVICQFNPTAEAMAEHLLHVIGPARLAGTGITLTGVRIEETRKCSAVASLD